MTVKRLIVAALFICLAIMAGTTGTAAAFTKFTAPEKTALTLVGSGAQEIVVSGSSGKVSIVCKKSNPKAK
jgi:hypothetical protein